MNTAKELVVLLHGYMRTAYDMRKVKKYLESFGYDIFAPTLPTTFRSVDDCTVKLEKLFDTIPSGDYDRVHFVGHSMGGLIIRLFLSRNKISNIGRCVLIATPNGGSDLAVKAHGKFGLAAKISPSVNDLMSPGLIIGPPLNKPYPEFGAIAGNKSPWIPGALIREDNDGRVAVSSVPFDGMEKFTVVPYRHTRIHKNQEVAKLVDGFLQRGSFDGGG